MLNEDEMAALESLIHRMTDKQRSGLEVWLDHGHDGRGGWANNKPLWPVVKKAQEYVHWYEVPPGAPRGTPEERKQRNPQQPHLTVVK
jgi:hypothetical protein